MFHDDVDSFDLIVDFRMIFDEQLDINFQSFAHQFSKVEDKLSVSIRYQDIEKIMQFSDVLIKRIRDFIYFHRWDENEVSHFKKSIASEFAPPKVGDEVNTSLLY
jgi:hypothetical protein